MALFEWDEKYTLNVKAMDLQHMQLALMINDLYRALLSTGGVEVWADVLSRMMDYANKHFRDEEKLLGANKYPLLYNQVEDHNAFIAKVTDYHTRLQEGALKMNTEVVNYLKQWLTDHILLEDRKYGPFLNERGIY